MNACYLYNKAKNIELIFCENSNISYPLHNHVSVVSLGIVLSGSLVLKTEKDSILYNENQFFIVYPYRPHSISTDTFYTLLTICIDKNVIYSTPKAIIKNNIVSVLLTHLCNKKIGRQYLLQVFNRLDEIFDSVSFTENSNSPVIEALISRLHSRPECKLSINDMAKNAFLSKYHFIRYFKKKIGLTPHQFQIQNRVRKAQRFLNESDDFAQAALSSGFYDQSHFIKQFEKHLGLTPSSYKSAIVLLPSDNDI